MGRRGARIAMAVLLLNLFCKGPLHAEERYVLEIDGYPAIYKLEDGVLLEERRLMTEDNWSSRPSDLVLRRSAGTYLFTASRPDSSGFWIFEHSLTATPETASTPIVRGRSPAVSPDGTHLAYADFIRTNNKEGYNLTLRNLETSESRIIATNLKTYHGTVWIDNTNIIYIGKDQMESNTEEYEYDMYIYDIQSDKRASLPFKRITPIAIGRNGTVICFDYDANRIVEADIRGGGVTTLVGSKIFRVGDFIMRPNGAGFLYTRQNFKSLFHGLLEVRNIYARNWQGNEVLVREKTGLSGGFALDDDQAVGHDKQQ